MEGFGDLLNLPFSEDWVKRIHIPEKEGYSEQNWFRRIHLKTNVENWGRIDLFGVIFWIPEMASYSLEQLIKSLGNTRKVQY